MNLSDSFLDAGASKSDQGYYEAAIEDFSKAIQLNPNSDIAYLLRGDAKFKLDQYEAAIEDFSKAIQLDPDNASAYNYRGTAKFHLNQYEAAIEDYSMSIQLDPDDINAYFNQGTAKFSLHQYEAAIEDFSTAIQFNPDNASVYFSRGVVKFKMHQYEAVIEDLSTAIQLNPDNASAYNYRGYAKHNLNQHEAAIEDFSTAIHLNPDDADSYSGRGEAKFHLKQYEAAIEDLSTAIQLTPDSYIAYTYRGYAKFFLCHYEAAIEDLSTAIQLNPESKSAYPIRGAVKLSLHQYEAAIEDFSIDIQLNPDPDNANSYFERGKIFQIIVNPYQALLDFNRFLVLADKEAFLKNRKKIFDFYETFPAPFLLERLLRSFIDYEHFQTLDGTIDQIRQQCQPMRSFLHLLDLRKAATETLVSYHHAQALICFYMGDPFAAFRIYDEKIDNPDVMGIPMNLMGHYYFIESARLFREPHENLLAFALQMIETTKDQLITFKAWREIYYAGMILYGAERIEETDKYLTQKEREEKQTRIRKNIEEAHECFTLAEGYLPAAYMKVLTLTDLGIDNSDQITTIRSHEAKIPAEERFLRGFPTRYFQMDDPDYFSPLLHYAHYKEILEAINEVRSPSEPFEHNDLWAAFRWSAEDLKQIEWFVRRDELSQIRRQLLQQFQSTIETTFQDKQPAEEILLLEKAFTQKLKNDHWGDTDYASFEALRAKVEGQPNAAQQIGLLISNSRRLSANSKMLLVEYFYLRGDLRIDDVFAMYFYIGTHQKGTLSNKVSEEASIDMGKKIIELMLDSVGFVGNILTAGAAAGLMRLLKNYFSDEEQIDMNNFRNESPKPLHSDYDAFVDGFLRFLSFQRESLGEEKFQQRFPLEGFEDWSKKRVRK
jgi:tetratricopeptide (TPR) repeat protein